MSTNKSSLTMKKEVQGQNSILNTSSGGSPFITKDLIKGYEKCRLKFDSKSYLPQKMTGQLAEHPYEKDKLIKEVYFLEQPRVPMVVMTIALEEQGREISKLPINRINKIYLEICRKLYIWRKKERTILALPNGRMERGLFQVDYPDDIVPPSKSKWFMDEKSTEWNRSPALLVLLYSSHIINDSQLVYSEISNNLLTCFPKDFPELCMAYVIQKKAPDPQKVMSILVELDRRSHPHATARTSKRYDRVYQNKLPYDFAMLCRAFPCGYPEYFIDILEQKASGFFLVRKK